jgi:hypothetical protein
MKIGGFLNLANNWEYQPDTFILFMTGITISRVNLLVKN